MRYLYKNIKSVWMLLFILAAIPSLVKAQAKSNPDLRNYTGTVKDRSNAGVAGVTIEVQEKQTAVVTDENGRFSLQAEINDILLFKKQGYLTKQVGLSTDNDLEVSLEIVKLFAGDEDDVEIPFRVVKKRYLTAAVSSLKAEDLPQPSTSVLTNLLSGRLAGLNVLQTNTEPGADFSTLIVRGRTSLQTSNALVLVDGTERKFENMDINEIESISVLKDAATLAWYGLRGSNGVVLITTKRGSAINTSIKFDAQYGLQKPDHLIEPLNSYEYATLYNEAYLNDRVNLPQPQASFYSQATLDAYKNGTDPFRFPDNNYSKLFLRKSTPVQRYALSAQGGSSTVRYFALFSMLNQQGLFAGTDGPDYNSNNAFKRYNFRGNIDFDVTSNLYLSVNISGRVENRISPGASNATLGILNSIYTVRPNAYPILNQDGSFGGSAEDTRNILGNLTANGVRRNLQRVGLATLNARQKLDSWVKGLSAHVLFSYDAQGDYAAGFNENYQTYDLRGSAPVTYGTEAPLTYPSTSFNNGLRSNEIWAGFDYERTFNAHQVNASIRGMRSVNVPFTTIEQRLQGLSARVEYGFKQKYLLSLVAGYSGNDNFSRDRRYGFFPAVSAGWIVSDEAFLAGNNLFSFVKLRASYGKSGNSDLGFGGIDINGEDIRRFPYRSYYNRNIAGGGYQFGTGFTPSNSASEINIGNPFITSETLTTTNAGIDFSLFKNVLSATIDVFKNRRSGILTAPAIPSIVGQDIGSVNAGIVDSKGFEGSLYYNKDIGGFRLTLNANILISADKVIQEGGQLGVPDYQSTIGRSAADGLYYLSDGLYQNSADIAAGPRSTLSGNVFPGDIRYKDVNGDKVIDALDRVRLNLGTPSYFGFGTVLKYKMIDLNAQFQGVSGRTFNIQSIINSGPTALNEYSINRFTPATASSAKYPRLGLADRGNNTATSDFWLRDADYIKLKTVELGINLPQKMISRLKMQGFRFYVSAFNPFTTTSLDIDVDPELPYAGRVAGNYPYVKTYSVGLSARF